MSKEEINEIIEEYNKGISLEHMSKTHYMSTTKLRKTLRDNNVHIRSKEETTTLRKTGKFVKLRKLNLTGVK